MGKIRLLYMVDTKLMYKHRKKSTFYVYIYLNLAFTTLVLKEFIVVPIIGV